MLSTLFGIVTYANDVHPENATCPIFVTQSGISIEVKLLHSANVLAKTKFITLSGISIAVKLEQQLNAPISIFVTFSERLIDVKPVQCANAYRPIVIMLSGIEISIRISQYQNASSPILVTAIPSISAGISTSTAVSSQSVIATVPSSSTVYVKSPLPLSRHKSSSTSSSFESSFFRTYFSHYTIISLQMQPHCRNFTKTVRTPKECAPFIHTIFT